ncbi:MAG: hypothetical protein C5B54_09280, partial [Acidobacteria bacterium]
PAFQMTSVSFPWFQIMETEYYAPMADALSSTGLKSEATIVMRAAGYVPFMTQFSHVDSVGLTDNYLSGRKPISLIEREQYIWSKHPDIYIGPELPASAGATDCASEPLINSEYVQHILLHDNGTNLQLATLHIYKNTTQQERCEALHARMRELRENWDLVGRLSMPLPATKGEKIFAFVRRASPHHEQLTKALKTLVSSRLRGES